MTPELERYLATYGTRTMTMLIREAMLKLADDTGELPSVIGKAAADLETALEAERFARWPK